MDWELADVVVLAVVGAHERRADGAPPPTVADVAAALGFDDGAMSDSVQLLSVSRTLLDRGLIEQCGRDGTDDERRRGYEPTEAGRDHAATLERRLADDRVTVVDEETTWTVPASDVGAVVDGLGREACLARLVHGSTLYRSRVGQRLVGRDRAFDRLLDAVGAPESRTVLVRGPAGVGKTALVEAFVDAVAGEATALVGACSPTVDEPYGPVRAALSDAPSAASDDAPALADGGRLAGARPMENPDVVAARATRFREQLVDELAARAVDGPLVFVVEDLQWVDAETLTFLDHLAGTGVAAAVVGTYRPGALGESYAVRSFREAADETVDLDSLDREETAALVAQRVGADAVPGSFVDRIHERTGGNPLFVREVLAQLPTTGVLDGAPDESTVELPTAVEDAVQGSLDELDDVGRDVLECVALAGRSVPLSVLVRVVDAAPPVVEEYVSLFADGRYLERDGDVVAFADERARTVLASDLDDDRRRRVHDALARAVAADADDAAGTQAQVAYHYERAGDPDRAYEAFLAAGQRAEDVYAHETAVDRYEAAMRTARESGDETALLTAVERKGAVHLGQGEYDAAEQAFEYVRERADDSDRRRMAAYHYSRVVAKQEGYEAALSVVEAALDDDPETTAAAARLLGQRGWVQMNLGNYETAVAAFERMAAMADDLDDGRLRAQANDHLGVTYFRADEADRAREHCRRAVDLVEPLDDAFTLGKYLNHLSMTIADRERSAEVYQRALAANREAGDVVTECDTLTNLGFLASKEDPAASLSYFEESAERAERLGYTKGVGAGNFNAGTVQIPLGELAEARERLTTSRNVHDDLGRVLFLHGDYDGLATIDLLRGDLASASESADRGLAVADDVGRAIDRVDSLITRGDVDRARDGPTAGRDAHRRALEIARDDGDARSLLFAHLALASDDVAVGDYRAALRHADAAAAYAEAESDRRRVASAAYRRGVALRGLGDLEAARAALDRAVAVARDRTLRLVAVAARFERAQVVERMPDEADVDPATDRERARELVAETGAVRLRTVVDREDAAVPTSV